MKTKIYTFRTFPWINQLKEPFIFSQLKLDLEKFIEEISLEKPDLILGVAKAKVSKSEAKAINLFNKNKLISHSGPKEYKLYIPKKLSFPLNFTPTSSFCNWTMYKISEYLTSHDLTTKLAFVHISAQDVDKLSLNSVN